MSLATRTAEAPARPMSWAECLAWMVVVVVEAAGWVVLVWWLLSR